MKIVPTIVKHPVYIYIYIYVYTVGAFKVLYAIIFESIKVE